MDESGESIGSLFPEAGRLLLSGTGKQFIERIGVEVARHIVLSVMRGENISDQTEPLTRQRLTQISGTLYDVSEGLDENRAIYGSVIRYGGASINTA